MNTASFTQVCTSLQMTRVLVTNVNINDAHKSLQFKFNDMYKRTHDVGLVINASKAKIVHTLITKKCSIKPTVTPHVHSCLHSLPTSYKCPSLKLVVKHVYWSGYWFGPRLSRNCHYGQTLHIKI